MQARFVSAAASTVIHVALVGAALVVAGTVAAPPQVIFLELTELETPPSPERPAPVPTAVQPPKPPKAPAAARREPPAQRPEPTPIEAPPAPAIVPPPALPAPPVATAPPAPTITPRTPADPAAATSGSEAASSARSTAPASSVSPNVASSGPAAAPPAPAVAALPRDGSPQRVIPRAVEQYRPAYPASARKARIQGTTLLAVLIADDGRVSEIVVKESAGHPDLDEAAAAAVRRWRFTPARRGNDAVAMWVELPVEFRLR